MLSPEQINLIAKMYDDVQNLKTEVQTLKEYKVDSTAAIKTLMTEKDSLVAELKLLKEANKPPAIVPPVTGQSGMGGLFGANTTTQSTAPATSLFTAPPTPAAGFSFNPSSSAQGFSGLATAAGKPTQSMASMWGARPTR